MGLQEGFTFYRPCGLLRPYVRYYWVLRSDGAIDELTYPIGCPQLIFHRKSPLFIPELDVCQPRFAVSAQVNFPSRLQSTGKLEMIVVVFHPHALGGMFGVPVSELYNREVSGYDLSDRRLAELAGRVFDTADTAECVRLIETWLLSVLHGGEGPTLNFHRIGGALNLLFGNPSVSIREMADCACLGPKQFTRVFRSVVGMNPKEYARIARFQKSLWMMQHGARDFASVAYECGYADQSHFIRECRAYSGHSPCGLPDNGPVYSDLFSMPV